jgi:predicted tellurium resistance membrane protein TerC
MFEISQLPNLMLTLGVLTFFEIILGIDNVIFLSIVTSRLPVTEQKRARFLGLLIALITRIVFLAMLFWLVSLTEPLFTAFDIAFSWRDILMIFGGLFLIYKSTQEMHQELQPPSDEQSQKNKMLAFGIVVTQIIFLDIVFSFDSLFAAIGISMNFWLISLAIWFSIVAMMFAATPLSHYIERNPTIKVLALSFLLLIGTVLIADGVHYEIPRGYIYFSVCFSLLTELLNSLVRKRRARWSPL